MRRMDGTYIISRNMQYVSRVATRELGLKKFDYHSLRHPDVKLSAKNKRLDFRLKTPTPDYQTAV